MDGLIGSVVGDSTRNKTTTESLEGDWDTATEEMRILRSEELLRGMSVVMVYELNASQGTGDGLR